MKKLLLSILFIATMILGVSVQAYTGKKTARDSEQKGEVAIKPIGTLTMKWFPLNAGDPTEINDALNRDLYGAGQDLEPCDGDQTYCGVYAEVGTDGKPILTSGTAAHTAINNYFNGNPSPLISERN